MNKYDDKFRSCKRTYSTLCIYPGTIKPEEITLRLKVEPFRIQHKGDLASSVTKRIIKLNGWFLTTKDLVKSNDCRRHVDWIIDKIKNKKKAILQLQSEGVEMYISCFWESRSGNGGPIISPPQMTELSKLNIEVGWDVWFAGFDE